MYDSKGSTRQEIWSPSTTGAQGWAHPIDGWAASSATAGCAAKKEESKSTSQTTRSESSQNPLSSAASSTRKKAKNTNGGVIAGAVLGALVGLIAILALVLFLLRRRKRAKEGEAVEQNDDGAHVEGTPIYQKDSDNARVEVSAVRNTELDGRKDYAYEMLVEQPVSEMPAGPDVGRSER
jgi:hypothetical protein